MDSPLQKGPDGLLGALDLKTLGRNPSMFGELLVGSFDCLPFYMLRNRKLSSQTAAFAAINAVIASTTIAIDEVWRVKNVGIVLARNVADAAVAITASIALRRATATGTVAVFEAIFPAVAATDLIQQRGTFFEQGLWLGPGDRLSLSCQTTINVGGTLTLGVDYDSMQSG